MPGRVLSILGPVLVTFGLLAATEGGLRLAGFEAKISAGADPKANLVPLFHPATRPDGVPVRQQWPRGGPGESPIANIRSTSAPNGSYAPW